MAERHIPRWRWPKGTPHANTNFGNGLRPKTRRSLARRVGVGVEPLEGRLLLSGGVEGAFEGITRSVLLEKSALVSELIAPQEGGAMQGAVAALDPGFLNARAAWLDSSTNKWPELTDVLGAPLHMEEGAGLYESAPGLASLPALPHLEVAGSVSADDPLDFYEILIHPDAKTILLTLQRPAGPLSPGLADQFMIFDESGEMLDGRPLGENADGVQFRVRLPDTAESMPKGMYVGVGRPIGGMRGVETPPRLIDFLASLGSPQDNSAESAETESHGADGGANEDSAADSDAASPSPYLLSVQQFPEMPTTEPPRSESGSATITPSPANELGTVSGGTTPRQVAATVVDTGASALLGRYETRFQVASIVESRPRPGSRPVPLRAAEPPGGILARGSPEDAVDGNDGTMQDVSLLELLVARDGNAEGADLAGVVGNGRGGAEDTGGVIVTALGIPLLGAQWPPVRLATNVELGRKGAPPRERLFARDPNEAGDSESDGSLGMPLTSLPREAGETDQNRAITCGLGLAYALAITCLLPDVKALVRSMARRAAPSTRRLPRRDGASGERRLRRDQSVAPNVT